MICPKCKSQLPAGAVSCPKCGTRFKTKTCPQCKSVILASASACPRCGAKFAAAKRCPRCSAVIPATAAACPKCGARFAQGASSGSDGPQKKSVLLLISAILGVLYAIFIVVYFVSAGAGAKSNAEALGIGIAAMLVMPHMICAVLAAIFNVLGWALSKRGFALTGGILYSVAAVMFPLYALFVLAQIILSFVGFAKLKKANT